MSILDAVTLHTIDDAGCMVWKRGCCNGHPAIRSGNKTKLVRRLLWEELHGPIPAGQIVRMTCGTVGCVHPEHIECTTYQRVAKQLGSIGVMSGAKRSAAIARTKRNSNQAKLNDEAVRVIRFSAEPVSTLAARYGVAQAHISKVRIGKAWRDFSSPWQGLGAMNSGVLA